MDAYLNKAVGANLSKIEDLPHEDLEGLLERVKECKELFCEYYFSVENYAVGVQKYSHEERKAIKSSIITMHKDIPFARLENGWVLGRTHIHFSFKSLQDFKLTYEEMANVTWHESKSLFKTHCSFCSPSGFYVGVDCTRMEAIKNLFATYPTSRKKWDNKINQIVGQLNDLIKQEFSASKSNALQELDKDSNGEIDLVENDFNKIIIQNQKQIIEVDRNYVQQFVKISNYIKTKRANTQKIFDSIRLTKNQKELEAKVSLVRNQVHAYEQMVFHSISMVSALLSDDMITFFEIYEAFDKLGIFNSNWQNEVSIKLDKIGSQLNALLVSIYQLENSLVRELNNLSYVTSESFGSLHSAMESQLKGIHSSISVNNLLSGIQSYQLYRLNQNLLN